MMDDAIGFRTQTDFICQEFVRKKKPLGNADLIRKDFF
jgi:hypothetical protein